MRLLIERVKEAKCIIENEVHSDIKRGYLVYCAFEDGDSNEKSLKALDKIKKLRIFTDEKGKLNLNLESIKGEVLIISSFSLFADLWSGNRPTFHRSLPYDVSKPLYDFFIDEAVKMFDAKSGVFGADMEIKAVNDGPISVILDI